MKKLLLLFIWALIICTPAICYAHDELDALAFEFQGSWEEVRSLWALPWDISSPSKVAKLVETAINSHQNELLVEVRYRSDALFDTSRGAQHFHNPEPRSHVLDIPEYDPLLDILQLAHAAGIQVHAWVIAFNATPLDQALLEQNYIYNNHPEWITYDANRRLMNTSSQYGYYIDPGIPEVQDYLLEIIGNLLTGYPDLDGIHLDYIRYPNENLGYHPVSLARYQEYCREHDEISFNEWRIMQVTGFVQRFQSLVKGINPAILTSAAVFADIADANVAYAQDWTKWLQKGYIDRVYPMAYSTKLKTFSKQLNQYMLLDKSEAIVVGIRAWRDDGASLLSTNGYNLADVAERIEEIRAYGFAGIALFSYAGIKPENAWKLLTEMSYPADDLVFKAQDTP